MKDYLLNLIDLTQPKETNKMVVREYLQEYFLNILYMRNEYMNLVFCGGTALRFLYGLKRFSEDLDFSASLTRGKPDFEKTNNILKYEFEKAAYDVEVSYNTDSNVNSSFFKFPGLLYELGVSGYEEEKISIKFEADMNPPEGGTAATTMLNRTFMFYVHHYDTSSLFAGKVHAAVCRHYTKGRDWYDLIWYMTKFPGITPNFEMLNNALKQTDPDSKTVNEENWKDLILNALDIADIEKAKNDVGRFLEVPTEGQLITKNTIRELCK